MSDDFETDDSDLFEIGEMVVVTLKDGRHYLGEFVGFYDTGIAVKVEAKTSIKVIRNNVEEFSQAVTSAAQKEVDQLKTPAQWMDAFNKLVDSHVALDVSLDKLREMVIEKTYEKHVELLKREWAHNLLEQDVTEPYLKELKRSVRTLVTWDKIDEVCSAVELAEEAEIADLTNLMDNEDFLDLIEGKKKED